MLLIMKIFAKDIGLSESLVATGSKAKKIAEFKIFCIKIGTTLKKLEHGTPWANLAELCIGILKYSMSKFMTDSNIPLRIWDYRVERSDEVHNFTYRNKFKLQSLAPRATLTWEQEDIVIYVNLVGSSGFTAKIVRRTSQNTNKGLENHQNLVNVQVMRHVSGCCNQMEK